MFPGGTFIEKGALEVLSGSQTIQLSYFSLKTHIKSKIGPQQNINGIPLRCPHTKNTHCTMASLMASVKSGSGQYRKIIIRNRPKMTPHPPGPWRTKLEDLSITNRTLNKLR